MIEIKAPNQIPLKGKISIFLAGSIEMGAAEDWQAKVKALFANDDVVLLNPRRDHWDPSIEQSIDNPLFCEQVGWELDALEEADFILVYFAPGTKSPISLLELGLFAHSVKLFVFCPDGFWRKGNIDIVCQRYGILQVQSFEEFYERIAEVFRER